jgi:hypothetical protein
MKKKTEKKLTLDKITIQDFQPGLSTDEQKNIDGGLALQGTGVTCIIVFC